MKEPKIRHVKKAGQWCVTYWEKGKQKQKWFSNEVEAKKFLEVGKIE
jgi:hypothetical protein